ncbi:hypothetical protein [Methylorubrum populi]
MTSKNIMGNSFNHHRKMATKYNEFWDITRAQWFQVWEHSPYCGEKGYINRIDRDGPWTASNIDFYYGTCPHNIHDRADKRPANSSPGHVPVPRHLTWTKQGTRTLSVREWVLELRAER